MENYRKLKTRAALTVFLISLISFVMLYLRISYVFESEITQYGSFFLQYILDTLTAVILAAVLLSGRGIESKGARILSSLKLSLPRLVYLVPYYYLYYMSEGYDSIESLGLLLIRSLFMLVLLTIEMHLYFGAACFAARRAEGKDWSFYTPSGLFDFSVGATVGIFAISFAKFIMNILSEGVDIITYLIDYGEFYSAGEIYLMLAKFTLAFIALFLSHVLVMAFRGRFIKRTYTEENPDE